MASVRSNFIDVEPNLSLACPLSGTKVEGKVIIDHRIETVMLCKNGRSFYVRCMHHAGIQIFINDPRYLAAVTGERYQVGIPVEPRKVKVKA